MAKRYKYFIIEDTGKYDCVVTSAMTLKEAIWLRIRTAVECPDGPALAITKLNYGYVRYSERREDLIELARAGTIQCRVCGSDKPHQHFVDRKGNVAGDEHRWV